MSQSSSEWSLFDTSKGGRHALIREDKVKKKMPEYDRDKKYTSKERKQLLWDMAAMNDMEIRKYVFQMFSLSLKDYNRESVTAGYIVDVMQEYDFYFVHTNFYKIYVLHLVYMFKRKRQWAYETVYRFEEAIANAKSKSMTLALGEWVKENINKGLQYLHAMAPKHIHAEIDIIYHDYVHMDKDVVKEMYLFSDKE
jgi:hypothetical protein